MGWRAFHRRIVPAAACGGLAAAALAWGGPARAGFSVCNDSFDVLNLAVAYDAGAGFVSEGWWTIAPNRCVAVIRDRILSRYVYVFATDVFNQALLAGDAAFCVADDRFRIPGADECWARGHVAAEFAEVDIGEAGHWTLVLDGSGTPPGD
ncbi:DUF1036 domain-containing protein [Roseovarius ramblicola]|uniref:DUF1036 domain-containing protein n=1 Tax=Roseovarius ramblicola TaxID=2022336 RepID=A0ABV5I3Q7_9RHOB